MSATALIALAVCLSAGNVVYQAATDQQWMVAFERSYFQCAALFAVALVQWLSGSKAS
jgi:hypothetical protein